ncbi:lipase/acylhydrolase [Paenibacillus faecis]|uniref:SGNH/GDSL hydrolase family protein n=1 Tax=Paenibacillus faecis TaxID=862114 RepID=A0A5D0D0D2_9BACL|nr:MULTISPECIES: SGNH/GDSL hydrolase family protein [Paenibacillus]MCA1293801.1 SGNH/GDSL hydrolase family protein [Paenibacillus sp. alder61]TYA15388.1 SGNH/GDSL hydrolase family protein [Paenibacillus faecis]GIO85853.1 lipase/acylhydrolase [Paenibacillus faecis]
MENQENLDAAAKYLVTGDSISKGVIYDEVKNKYVLLEDNYVSLLQNKLKGAVRNTARFGNTLIKGMANLRKDVMKDKPNIVLIEYGGNDCDFNWNEIADNPNGEHRPKTDFNLFEKMLTEAVQFLKSQQITPVLMSLPPLNADSYFKWVSRNNPDAEKNILQWLGSVTKIYWWQERYNSTILKVSELTKTKFIDVRGAFLEHPDFTQFLCSDGIHPNQAGHKIISDKVLEFIRQHYGHLLRDHGGLTAK